MGSCKVVANEHGRYSLSCMQKLSSAGSVWYVGSLSYAVKFCCWTWHIGLSFIVCLFVHPPFLGIFNLILQLKLKLFIFIQIIRNYRVCCETLLVLNVADMDCLICGKLWSE